MTTTNPTNIVREIYGTFVLTGPARVKLRKVHPRCASIEMGSDGVFRINEQGPQIAINNIKPPLFEELFVRLQNQLAKFGRHSWTKPQAFMSKSTLKAYAGHLDFTRISLVLEGMLGGLGRLAVIGACVGLFILGMNQAQQQISRIDWQLLGQALQGDAPDAKTTIALAAPVKSPIASIALPASVAPVAPNPEKVIAPETIPFPSPLSSPLGGHFTSKQKFPSGTPGSTLDLPQMLAQTKSHPEDTEEAVSVTIASRPAPAQAATSENKTASTPEGSKTPAKWVAVTFNDGHLVMRNQGTFKQIAVGQPLPTGETLKSINESTGDVVTSAGNFSIKGDK